MNTVTALLKLAMKPARLVAAGLYLLSAPAVFARNVIIFVADGLRSGSVNEHDAPTLAAIRQKGVFFQNSHALFPTFTTPNASAIATGHYLGDTGDFSNTVYTGYPIGLLDSTQTPFIESDSILSDIDKHFSGNFLDEETFLAFAKDHGFETAAVGKLGPTLIQVIAEANPVRGSVPVPETIIVDDATGKKGGIPLSSRAAEALTAAKLPLVAPDRSNRAPPTAPENNGYPGTNETPGTLQPNVTQQQYFADAFTKAVLPLFVGEHKPFAAVFWSRDPDGTQHNQGDSLNQLSPGINGPTSRAAVRNADNNLKQILDYLQSVPGLLDDTDLFITSDHGFSTISKGAVDSSGQKMIASYATTKTYRDSKGRQEVNTGFLPSGFLAIDLAHELKLPLFDPDRTVIKNGEKAYKPIDPEVSQTTEDVQQRPSLGNAFLGGSGAINTPTDATIVVAANGGSDLIYLPKPDASLVQRIVDFLCRQEYVSGLFTDPEYEQVKGALPLTAINLKGSSVLPAPAIVVNFRSFTFDENDPLMTAVTICDTGLQQGQGMHGSFSRADTWNNMAAYGPDFKTGHVDEAPAGNADIARTLAYILKFEIPLKGDLTGRVLLEALASGPETVAFSRSTIHSEPNANGVETVLNFQAVGGTRYFDAAGFAGRTVGLKAGR